MLGGFADKLHSSAIAASSYIQFLRDAHTLFSASSKGQRIDSSGKKLVPPDHPRCCSLKILSFAPLISQKPKYQETKGFSASIVLF